MYRGKILSSCAIIACVCLCVLSTLVGCKNKFSDNIEQEISSSEEHDRSPVTSPVESSEDVFGLVVEEDELPRVSLDAMFRDQVRFLRDTLQGGSWQATFEFESRSSTLSMQVASDGAGNLFVYIPSSGFTAIQEVEGSFPLRTILKQDVFADEGFIEFSLSMVLKVVGENLQIISSGLDMFGGQTGYFESYMSVDGVTLSYYVIPSDGNVIPLGIKIETGGEELEIIFKDFMSPVNSVLLLIPADCEIPGDSNER